MRVHHKRQVLEWVPVGAILLAVYLLVDSWALRIAISVTVGSAALLLSRCVATYGHYLWVGVCIRDFRLFTLSWISTTHGVSFEINEGVFPSGTESIGGPAYKVMAVD